jgi:transcriptional regulator with PAS, ATPase and Fis domain
VDSTTPLLILGETGVGKEHLARAIHNESRRTTSPFVSVNCGAIPEQLLESHLFGHEKGAFTGASRPQRGCFELAHGGTIFLDEICEMHSHLQVKLLHVLQNYEVLPIGREQVIPVDVRIMAATNRDIKEEIAAGRFRQDLYYRLSVVELVVPSLRERRGDIPILVESFIQDLGNRIGRNVSGITPEALERLEVYPWPGNIRELINVLERSILLCEGSLIDLEDLPMEIVDSTAATALEHPRVEGEMSLSEDWLDHPIREVREWAIHQAEKAYLIGLLTRTGGRIAETADMAGIDPRSVHNKMKRYGLHKETFRNPPPRLNNPA